MQNHVKNYFRRIFKLKYAQWSITNYKNITSYQKFKYICVYPTLVLTVFLTYCNLLNTQESPTGSYNLTAKQSANGTSIRENFNFIGDVVKKCSPGVVYIEIHDPRRIDPETNEPIVVSNGSGFIIKEDGWILTNAHVVISKPQAVITAKLRDGSIYKATVEDADVNMDLALVKIETTRKLPVLQFGKPNDVDVGEWVVALGSPLSLPHSVTAGIISSTNRSASELGLMNQSMQYIQTDASITFGNSGGPLVNLDGHVIGINNLRITAGISFAIPIGYAKKFLSNSKVFKSAVASNAGGPSWQAKQLGLTTMRITDSISSELQGIHGPFGKEVGGGALVWKVLPGSPAHKSGLEAGDVITHVNGSSVEKPEDVFRRFDTEETNIQVDIVHKGRKKKLTIHVKNS